MPASFRETHSCAGWERGVKLTSSVGLTEHFVNKANDEKWAEYQKVDTLRRVTYIKEVGPGGALAQPTNALGGAQERAIGA
jgi:hypothetical protein